MAVIAAFAGVLVLFLPLDSALSGILPKSIEDSIGANTDRTISAVFAGALIAVSVSYFSDLFARYWGTQDPSGMPPHFYQEAYRAAKKEVEDIGYYRANSIVRIGQIDQDGNLRFVLESDIIGVRNTDIPARDSKIEPPANFKGVDVWLESYEIDGRKLHTDGQGLPETIPIKKGDRLPERLEVVYRLKGRLKFEDEHTWDTPVFREFTVYFELPGYECRVSVTKGSKREPLGGSRSLRKKFTCHHSLFTHQGFSWSIKKEEEKNA